MIRRTAAGTRANPDRFRFVDLVAEATSEVSARPVRLLASVIGTVLGVSALIATIGLSQTSAHQIAEQFDSRAGTHALVAPATVAGPSGTQVPLTTLRWDAATQISRISGVEQAALLSQLALGERVVSAVSVDDPSAPQIQQPRVYAASPDIVLAAGASMVAGRMFDSGHDHRADRVAVVSARAAARLGVADIASQPSVFIGDTAYAVIGIYDNARNDGELQDAVIVPNATGRVDFGLGSPDEVLVQLAPHSGPILSAQGPLALSPNEPDTIVVSAPGGVSDLQSDVQSDLSVVFIVLSIVVLLAGGFGIANVTMLSVLERTPEIGLRRAVGATPRQIAAQFFAESVITGVLGGLIGSALGVLAIEIVAAAHHWSAVTNPGLAVAGVVLGAVVALVACALPARRAARIEPVDALRGD